MLGSPIILRVFFRSENKRKVLWKSQCWSPYTFSTPLACDATLERGDWGGKWRVREWSILIHKILPKERASNLNRWVEDPKRLQNMFEFVQHPRCWLTWKILFLTTFDDEVLDKWKNQVQGRRHEWKNARTDELTHLFGAFGSVIKWEGALKPSWSIDIFITIQVANIFVGWRIFYNCLPKMVQKSTEFLTCKLLVVNMPQVYFIPNVVNWGSEPTKMTAHVQLD